MFSFPHLAFAATSVSSTLSPVQFDAIFPIPTLKCLIAGGRVMKAGGLETLGEAIKRRGRNKQGVE